MFQRLGVYGNAFPAHLTRLQRSSSGFDPGFLHSLLRGGRNCDCVYKIKSQDVTRQFLSKKKKKSIVGGIHTHNVTLAFANPSRNVFQRLSVYGNAFPAHLCKLLLEGGV
jgi:hypothetical protein